MWRNLLHCSHLQTGATRVPCGVLLACESGDAGVAEASHACVLQAGLAEGFRQARLARPHLLPRTWGCVGICALHALSAIANSAVWRVGRWDVVSRLLPAFVLLAGRGALARRVACALGSVHIIFERCVAFQKLTRQGAPAAAMRRLARLATQAIALLSAARRQASCQSATLCCVSCTDTRSALLSHTFFYALIGTLAGRFA